ncbi:MAG: gamma-glutamyltransferase [Bacteroidetes bacterium]|nr:gamma-glutamyltransferase [Bacteroidota bacterium]MCL5025549.1 gamma-glutamyltransferase [Chloroflexota bacterium]
MRGVIAAPQPEATVVGRWALSQGGNAIDAAIATAFAQGIVDPMMNGIGGNGTLHVYPARTGEDLCIDFYGRVPLKATPDMFVNDIIGPLRVAGQWELKGHINQVGYKAVTTPGTMLGLWELHRRYATMPWKMLAGPAIRMAREGFVVPGEIYRYVTTPPQPGQSSALEILNATPAMAAIYTKNGEPYKPGEVLRNPDYANSLEQIAEHGPKWLYEGEIPRRIAADFAEHGGLLTEEDFRQYRVRVSQPVKCTFHGYTVSSNPSPGAGPQLLEILNILEGWDLEALGFGEAEYVRRVCLAQRASFADRVDYLCDPEFGEVPTDMLISKERAAHWRERIEAGERFDVCPTGPAEPPSTTTVSAMDEEGNAVNITHTLGSPGSGAVVPGLGFQFNNSMFGFDARPGHVNSMAPGKARTTGMSPTVVFKDGDPVLVLGAPGATKILTGNAQVIVNILVHGMTPVEAVAAPRMYCESQYFDLEPRLYYNVRDELEAKGYRLLKSPFSYDQFFALVHAVQRDPASGKLAGAADPRNRGGVSWWND